MVESPLFKDGDSWYTTIKVDGEDIQVPFDDLKSSHQKDKASQRRFEQAAEYGRKVQEKEAQLNAYVMQMKQREEESQKQEVPPSQDAVPEEEPDNSDLIKQYHQALYEDDADKAAELFMKALGTKGRSTQAATPNVEKVVQEVLGRTFAQQKAQQERQKQWAFHKSLEDAVNWFETEYPDIAKVPELRAVADNRTIDLTQQHPDWSHKDVMKEAAESTRQWAKEFLSPNKNERAERKKKLVQNPKAANASARIGEDEAPPQGVADIIQEMKEARGQML